MHKMFDARHVTGAKSAIPGETPLDEPTDVNGDDTDDGEDQHIKAKRRKRKSKAVDDDFVDEIGRAHVLNSSHRSLSRMPSSA